MENDEITWLSPWRKIEYDAEIPGIQNQLELEISKEHQLWSMEAKVLGRRVDCDDIVIKTKDNIYAIVHLVWSTGSGDSNYPSTKIYESINDFIKQMKEDAAEYGEE